MPGRTGTSVILRHSVEDWATSIDLLPGEESFLRLIPIFGVANVHPPAVQPNRVDRPE